VFVLGLGVSVGGRVRVKVGLRSELRGAYGTKRQVTKRFGYEISVAITD